MFDRRRLFQLAAGIPLIGACTRQAPPAREAKQSAARGETPALDGSAAPPFPTLLGFCDAAQPIPATEHGARQERARKLLTDSSLAALITEAGPTMRYFSDVGWRRSERPLLLVLPRRGEPVWVAPAFEAGTLGERLPRGATLRTWQEHESPYDIAVAAVRERVQSGAIALEPTTRLFIAEGLRKSAGSRGVTDGTTIVASCRMRKSASELALLRRANQATKAALELAAGHARPGMTEDELGGIIRSAQEAAGLRGIWALVGFGPHAAFPHGTRERRPLQDGDLILVDTGGSLHGYQSDITRTWPFGRPGARARRVFDAVLAAQQAAMEKIRPGARAGDVDAAARGVIEAAGFGGDYQQFTHRLGHGIGLEGHEAPYLVRNSDLRLEPGMTMSNEPGIYIPGELGVRIEDIVAVTDSGHEVFGPRAQSVDNPFGA